jgi:hypothetical protein
MIAAGVASWKKWRSIGLHECVLHLLRTELGIARRQKSMQAAMEVHHREYELPSEPRHPLQLGQSGACSFEKIRE